MSENRATNRLPEHLEVGGPSATTGCTWHHSLLIEPWEECPGGVVIADWGDCVDAEPQPKILLRDRGEAELLINAILAVVREEQP